ncbi:MAG: trimeric intracellular cation channel family protein [Ruminococcaceae bacterium]|nr:trimeric intracellular cation channel family protein [Oscillospiraceae bacterium]
MLSDFTVFVLNIIGTVSFAISGALVSIKARLDLFGVVFLGIITAFGGGIMRDILLGFEIPNIFYQSYLVIIALVTSVAVFIILYINRNNLVKLDKKISYFNNFFDAIGLGAFTVMGTEIAFTSGVYENVLLSVTLGFLTAVGGGIIRDVLANTAPFVLKKHVYALVSILGAFIYYYMRIAGLSVTLASSVVIGLVFALRLFATRYEWTLPKIKYDKQI